HILGVVMFLGAALTDYFDGHIARSRGQVTRLGQLLDPIADKLLISAALISLVENQLAPAWAVVIIIGREFAVTGLRSIAAVEDVEVQDAGPGGHGRVTHRLECGGQTAGREFRQTIPGDRVLVRTRAAHGV